MSNMYSDREPEKFKQGYEYGERMNLNNKIVPPKGLTEKEESDWQRGVTAAICDRMS
ncbi:hypothetical protein SHOU24_43 [Vibrio phage SHOU24]|uniref:hypothetical protein n=1 Tax=Vibrio phage SHOU24 TaxID=1414739 RepID=UPI0003ED1DB2|nr:hypothetical protein SHOU24_43 [Vibrio phage SHOU24]AHI61240.1 hypothetical protein SHOU24_43 [Vibrio phage SHOU24]